MLADGAAPRLPQRQRVDRYRGRVDDNFDDYVVDKDSMTEGVGEDGDTGIDVETDVDPGIAANLEADTGIDSEIDAPEPATWTRSETTGVASVDAAIEELTRLDELPTGEHVAVYEDLHRRLQDALADLDGS